MLEVELAYVLGRAFWGYGYATEAGRAVLAYGFGELGVRRVLSPISSANARSIALARRLGCHIRRNLHPRPSRYLVAPAARPGGDRTDPAARAAAQRDARHPAGQNALGRPLTSSLTMGAMVRAASSALRSHAQQGASSLLKTCSQSL